MSKYASKTEKFLVTSTLLNKTTGGSKDISANIENIAIQNDYLENSFPLFVIGINGTKELIDEIQFNSVKIYLKISSFIQDDTDMKEDDSNIAIDNVLFETTIRCYDKPIRKLTSSGDVDKEETDNDLDNSAAFVKYQISGIPENLIEKNKTIINEVFEQASMNEILINIFSSVDNNELYIEDSNNKVREKSLLIPPLNLVQTVRYLQDFYGIYEDNLCLYFDIDKTYIYSLNNEKKIYDKTFSIELKETKKSADVSIYNRPLFNSNGDMMMYLKNITTFSSQKEIIDDNLGNETIFYSYDDEFNLNIRKKTDSEIFEKVRYYWNENQTKIKEESFYNSLKKSKAIAFIFNNISPTYFKPNTKFLINGNDKIINGEYALIENSVLFSTSDFKQYTSDNSLKLIKIK